MGLANVKALSNSMHRHGKRANTHGHGIDVSLTL